MPRKKLLNGAIGNGWVEEIRTIDGTKFVARWQFYVADPDAPDGRRRESGHQEIGPKVYHGPKDALTSKSAAERKWAQIRDSVMGRTQVLPAALKAGLLLDIELPVEPIEAEIESTGTFQDETGPGVEPKPKKAKWM